MNTLKALTSVTDHDNYQMVNALAPPAGQKAMQGAEAASNGAASHNNQYPAAFHKAWADQFRSWGISPEVAASRGYSVIEGEGDNPAKWLKQMHINGTTKQG